MSELMQQHERWSAARERLWKPVRRDLRKLLAGPPILLTVAEDEPWGCPLNMLSPPSPRFLIKLVALRREVSARAMIDRVKTVPMVAARDEAIALIYTHCRRMSLPELGRLFGGRDHTTILHSLRKMRLAGRRVYRVSPTINRMHSEDDSIFTNQLAPQKLLSADQTHEPRSTQDIH
jgi:hypothetical protein